MNSRVFIDYQKAKKAYDSKKQEDESMKMEQLKMLQVTASEVAFERIANWTEALGICTFSFFELLEQTVCPVEKIKKIVYDESTESLYCDCISDMYDIMLGYNHEGVASRVVNISHFDKITSVDTNYQYTVVISRKAKPKMKLSSMKRCDGYNSVIVNLCSGITYVDCGEYSQTIMFGNNRINGSVEALNTYVNALFANIVTDAKSMLQYLVTRFNVTGEEFAEMRSASVNIRRFNRTVSEIIYRKGKLVSVTFVEDNEMYILYADGTWHYIGPKWDIKRTEYRSELWHMNGYMGDDSDEALEKATETVEAKKPEFFDVPLIEFTA